MAELQLPVCSVMDPAACNPRLPATGQERYLPEALEEQLEHLRNNTQQQLLFSNDKLADLHIQKRQHSFCSQPAESTRGVLEKAGFSSAGTCNWYFKGQESTLPARWRSKRREGVDRSYPLKPVFHHKGRNAPLPITWQAGYLAVKGNPSGNTTSDKKGRSHTLKSQLVGAAQLSPIGQSKILASHSRAEPGYIQKLEADGRNLEEEIQRKEALLKQKLRRTEEELRRIQRGRQQAGANARKEQGTLWMPERKAAEIAQGCTSRFTAQQHICQKTCVSECPTVSLGVAVPSQGLTMERLKKQRLVASNSKIRENILASSSPEPAPLRGQYPLSPTPIEQPGCAAAEAGKEDPSREEEWGECHICERRLYCSRLEKHIRICSKNHGSKREVFDSSKARAKGTELETYNLLKGSGSSQRKFSNPNSEASKQSSDVSKQSNWRQKHDSFIKTLRRAREVQRVISKGGKASDLPPAPAMENPDYKLCPYCTRQFAPKVAERHIPKCKNIKNRPPPPQQKRRC